MSTNKKQDFWDSRAELGEHAGTNDFLLKSLEMELLRRRVAKGSSVIDLGCGNGKTLVDLAVHNSCSGLGIDFSEKMVASARDRADEKQLSDRIIFQSGNLADLSAVEERFDYAVTERSLINLDSPEKQYDVFKSIMKLVKPGGTYLMIESSRQGLERTNLLREKFGLDSIPMPWHNVFVDETLVEAWGADEWRLDEIFPFSSTYYLLSRVVYAKLAHDNGEELRYDSDINKLSCELPVLGDYGPTRLWVWKKQ